jgi:uncharacterized protein involved in exopolysaccharide biosynthesis
MPDQLSHDMEPPERIRVPEPPGSEPSRAASGDELTLGDFVRPLWTNRYVIASLAVVFGLAAGIYSATLRPKYEATAVLRVIESKSVEEAEPARAENFRPLLENKTIAAGLVEEFALVGESRFKWGGGTEAIHPDQFVGTVLNVDQVVGTNLLRVRVALGSPGLAAKVANTLVERAIELNRRINQQEVVEARDFIKSQLDEAIVRVQRVQSELVATRQRSQVDALKSDAEGMLDMRARLLALQAAVENERAFLARSEADLRQSEPLLTTRRSIDREPALMELARERAPGTAVLGLGITEQEVSTAHADLQKQVAQSRATLAGLESQRRFLVDQQHLDRAALPTLSKFYEAEETVSKLQADYYLAIKVYIDLATRYEEARIQVGGRGVQLQLVDPAVPPPPRPASGMMTGTVGALLGVLIGCALALGRQFVVPLLRA